MNARRRRRRGIGRAAAAACLAALTAAGPVGAASGDGRAGQLLGQLRTLYGRAYTASQTYDAASARLAQRQRTYDTLNRGLAGRREAEGRARAAIGTLARERYRDGALSPYARLLLAGDPRTALSQLRVLGRAQAAQDLAVRRLRGEQGGLARQRARAARELAAARGPAAAARTARDRTADDLALAEDAIASPQQPPAP